MAASRRTAGPHQQRHGCCCCHRVFAKQRLVAKTNTGRLFRRILCGLFLYFVWLATLLFRYDLGPTTPTVGGNGMQQHRSSSTTNRNNNNNYTNHYGSSDSTKRTTTTTAACLMVMDDNHFLIEWIAYHYHTANLRRLVIAVDAKSLTSPLPILQRWKDKIDLTVWTRDSEYTKNVEEFESTQQEIRNEFRETTPRLVEHRARQRLFYTHCLRTLKREEASTLDRKSSSSSSSSSSSWTLLVDVDEFLRVNTPIANHTEWWQSENNNNHHPPSMDQPGSVAIILEQMALTSTTSTTTTVESKSPWDALRTSPCIALPRYRYISTPTAIDDSLASSMLTQNYRNHARAKDINTNKIAKTVIDLGRIPLEDILPVNSIHMPIRKHCSNKNLHNLPTDRSTLLVVNHYLGSYEQFTYRQHDARNQRVATSTTKVNVRNAQKFEDQQKLKYAPDTDDAIVPWLDGFLQTHPAEEEGRTLLNGVGQTKLTPQSWKPFFDPDSRCALLFFGLPRSYKDMVLPSLVRNVLEPNARHGCDVYVHFYQQTVDAPGRYNNGGPIEPEDIFLLEDAVRSVAQRYHDKLLRERDGVLFGDPTPFRPPIVAFTHDTPEDFRERYEASMKKYHEETVAIVSEDGSQRVVPAYFPWKTTLGRKAGYSNSTVDNIVKQWHSIQSSFKLMDFTAKMHKISYSRVGMFRSDALYVTPIDIASLGAQRGSDEDDSVYPDTYDVHNQFFVTPAFSGYPVNDRMVYGPYEAVKIWATKRFDLLEESVRLQTNPGWQMHSERFLNTTVFPAMEEVGSQHATNENICFLRTRADHSALTFDCCKDGSVPNPKRSFWNKVNAKQERVAAIEALLNRKCVEHQPGAALFYVVCNNKNNEMG